MLGLYRSYTLIRLASTGCLFRLDSGTCPIAPRAPHVIVFDSTFTSMGVEVLDAHTGFVSLDSGLT